LAIPDIPFRTIGAKARRLGAIRRNGHQSTTRTTIFHPGRTFPILVRQSGQVLGVDGAKRRFRFPVWQLDEDGRPFMVLPALHATLGNAAWAV
jgi:hypothetical protein